MTRCDRARVTVSVSGAALAAYVKLRGSGGDHEMNTCRVRFALVNCVSATLTLCIEFGVRTPRNT